MKSRNLVWFLVASSGLYHCSLILETRYYRPIDSGVHADTNQAADNMIVSDAMQPDDRFPRDDAVEVTSTDVQEDVPSIDVTTDTYQLDAADVMMVMEDASSDSDATDGGVGMDALSEDGFGRDAGDADAFVPIDVPITPSRVEVTCDRPATEPRPLVTNGVVPRVMLTCTVTARGSDLFFHGARLSAEGPSTAFNRLGYDVAGGAIVSAPVIGGSADVSRAGMLLPRDTPTQVRFYALLNRADNGPCGGTLATGSAIRLSLEASVVTAPWNPSYAGQLNLDIRDGMGISVYAAGIRQTSSPYQLRNGYPTITMAPTPARYVGGVEQDLFCFDEEASMYGAHAWRSVVISLTGDPSIGANAIRLSGFRFFEDGIDLVGGYSINTYPQYDSAVVSLLPAASPLFVSRNSTVQDHIIVTTNTERLLPAGTRHRYCLRATVTLSGATGPIRFTMRADPLTTGSTGSHPTGTTERLGGNICPGPYFVPFGRASVSGIGLATDLAAGAAHVPGAMVSGSSSCDFFGHGAFTDLTVTLMP